MKHIQLAVLLPLLLLTACSDSETNPSAGDSIDQSLDDNSSGGDSSGGDSSGGDSSGGDSSGDDSSGDDSSGDDSSGDDSSGDDSSGGDSSGGDSSGGDSSGNDGSGDDSSGDDSSGDDSSGDDSSGGDSSGGDSSGNDGSGDDSSGDDSSGDDSSGDDSSGDDDNKSDFLPGLVAKITDNMTHDAGELRYRVDSGSILVGKLTAYFLKENNVVTADGQAKDAYIGLYGDSTSTDDALVDLRIKSDSYQIRNKDVDMPVGFTADKWTKVEMTWDASNATSTEAPLIQVTIDGIALTDNAFESVSSSKSDVIEGVEYVIFKLGDNSSTIPNAAFYVDDIKLFADHDEVELLFSDDFETFDVNDLLTEDNADSPYHSKTAEAKVVDYDNDASGDTPTDGLSCNSSYSLGLSSLSLSSGTSQTTDLNKVIDSDKTNSSTWYSQDNQSVLLFELAEQALVKDVIISWGQTNLSHSFEIDTSVDGSNWQSATANGQSQSDYIIPERIDIDSNAQNAKYLRLSLNGTDSDVFSGLTEVELFGCSTNVQHNIELIDWYLSVQTDEDNNGKSDSISEAALAAGYEDPRFFYTSKDGGLVFASTVQGYRTSTNTKYVRSELREMLRRGNTAHKTQGVNQNNWVFSSAPQSDLDDAGGIDGTLDVDIAVNHVTSTGEDYQIGRVIIGQIHANDDEPVRLYYRKLPENENGSIYIAHELLDGDDTYYEILGSRSDSASNPSNGIPLGEQFSYQIKVVGNELTVTITKADGTDYVQVVDMSDSGYDQGGQYMYFKAGVYNQNNSGDLHDYVQATFYKIDNQHN